MKKTIIAALCLILLATAVLPVSAASAAGISPSANTVYRGDSLTLTVTLSSDTPVTNGSLKIALGSGLTLVSGNCQISGVAIGSVSVSQGICSFAFDTGVEKTLSGTAFTLQLQVAEDAAFGSAPVSVSGSLMHMNEKAPVSASCTVNIACKHSFANAASQNDNTHLLTCSSCGEPKQENHTNTVKVNKPASCKDAGSETLTCSVCGHSKEQSIPKTDTHTYSIWTKLSDTQHTRSCSVCGKVETTAHNWNSGTVTKAATCIATGSRVCTCTGCKATKTETIPKATSHPYGDWETTGAGSHSRSCPICKKTETADHSFDNWSHDELNHFKLCSGCGQRNEQAAHVPGPEATDTTDQICTLCQRVLKPSTAHVHTFDSDWTTDESYHWHRCSQCEEKQGLSIHVYTDNCDADCDVCGSLREAPHSPAGGWASDADSHWYSCTACGTHLQQAPHVPGPEATLQSAQVCTLCGCELASRLTHSVHMFSREHTHTCPCGEINTADADCLVCAAERAEFPWWWIFISLETLILGIIVIYWLIRKKY